jgi:hypothetical protein
MDRGAAAVDDWTIPPASRATLAAAALARRVVSAERLSRLTRENPDLEGALLPLLQGPGDLWSVLQFYPPFLAAQSVHKGARLLPLPGLTDVVPRLLPLLDGHEAKNLERALRRLRKDIPIQVWDDEADRTLIMLVGNEVRQTNKRLSTAALSSCCGDGPVGAACRVVLDEVLRAGQRFDSHALARLADALTHPNLEQQPEFRTFAAQALVQEATRYEDLEGILSHLARPLRENAFDWFVAASLRNIASRARGSQGLALLTLQFAIVRNVAANVAAPLAGQLDQKGWDQLEAAFAASSHRERRRLDALAKATSPASSRSWFSTHR